MITRGSSAPPRAFICYCKQDIAIATQLFDLLNRNGINAWLDKKCLKLGDKIDVCIEKAVSQADAVVVLLRPQFEDVGYRQREVKLALDASLLRPGDRSFIIPFIIEPCELPQWCQGIHAGSDLSRRTGLDELLLALGELFDIQLVERADEPKDATPKRNAGEPLLMELIGPGYHRKPTPENPRDPQALREIARKFVSTHGFDSPVYRMFLAILADKGALTKAVLDYLRVRNNPYSYQPYCSMQQRGWSLDDAVGAPHELLEELLGEVILATVEYPEVYMAVGFVDALRSEVEALALSETTVAGTA
ncbi:MAG: toll/interleukin-1 receptor domain-containing protein [Phycisphaerales bacterium]|nr:toll/interleukin-1 receptor domain-containing protein [Phycisphaerales bacterium]